MGFTFDFAEDAGAVNTTSTSATKTEVPVEESKMHSISEVFTSDSTAENTFFTAEFVNLPTVGLSEIAMVKRSLSDITYEATVEGIALAEDSTPGTAQQSIVSAIQTQSDLIPGVYEGGAKTWECSLDLVELLHSKWDVLGLEELQRLRGDKPLRVLELGCGSALPGIYCLTRRGCSVCFHDYNGDVVRKVTIPNVGLNSCSQVSTVLASGGDSVQRMVEGDPKVLDNVQVHTDMFPDTSRAVFASGDWSKMKDIMHDNPDQWDENGVPVHGFDVVLTSETVYAAENHRSLMEAVRLALRGDGRGVALVAAKATYFGCSGSLELFAEHARKCSYVKSVDTVASVASAGVRRDVLRIVI